MANWSKTESKLLHSLLPAELVQTLLHPETSAAAISASCEQLEAKLTRLLPFVPTPIADLHLRQPGAGRIEGRYLTGSVLCADLSGFTMLSSELAAYGPQGSEEVSTIINQLFAALLTEIYAYGGGLLQFGGDALTAFFEANRLGQQHTTLACMAALAMQERMQAFAAVSTSRGMFQLRLRIAVHSGRVFVAEVGDEQHIEMVSTGRAINRVMVAQESAAPGEVIISAEALSSLDGARVETRPNDLYLLHELTTALPPRPTPVLARPSAAPSLNHIHYLLNCINTLQPYIPHGLPQRFTRAQVHGEFRPVTVLFASFYAFNRLLTLLEFPALVEQDPGIVGRVLNTYYTHSQAVVHRYGGSINKIDMAAFGNRLMALFGAPTAHEDDDIRAVRVALGLRAANSAANEEIAQLLHKWITVHPHHRPLAQMLGGTLRQRVGIASGTVFAGIVGTPQRHEYTVMGESVNLAARLVSVANNGSILLTSRVQRAIQHLLETQPLPPLMLKGFAGQVPMFRLVQERETADTLRHAAPLIGRQRELAHLQTLQAQALQRGEQAGRVVAIIGEPGIGKSRLAYEVLRPLRLQSPATLIIRDTCQSYEQTTPYALIGRLMRQLLAIPATAERSIQAAFVQEELEALVPEWSRFAALLGPLLSLPLRETDLTRALTPDQRYERLHDLLVMICFALARRQSLVLVCDNVQWADASSRAVIERLAMELARLPLLLLLIYRPRPEIPTPWATLPHCTQLHLGELAQEDSESLLSALLEGELPTELEPLIKRTYGTPFFLEETVRYLVGTGVLRRNENGNWICTRPITNTTVPAQIEQLIMARLDRLPEMARELVQVAAVVGQRFSEEVLVAMMPNPETLTQRLDELVYAALLLPDDDATTSGYVFRHALIHDVVYDSMLFARRRELHAQAAAAIEQIYAHNLDDHRVVLAQHYRRADQLDRAFPNFLAAAHQAQQRYANSEALALYNQALATAPWRDQRDQPSDPLAAATIYEQIGDIQALIGSYDEARQNYEWSLRLLDHSPEWQVQLATLQRKVGSSHEQQGSYAKALEWFDQAAATIATAASDNRTALEHACILSDTGWVHFRQSNLEHAQHYLEQALALVQPREAYLEQARILNRLGGVAYHRGDLSIAKHYVEQSIAVSQRSGDLLGQANALNNLGNLTGSQGHFADSIHYSLQAMEIMERIGNRRGLAFTANNVGWAFYDSKDFPQAQKFFTQAYDCAVNVHDVYAQSYALLNLGRVMTATGQWSNAENLIKQSQQISEQNRIAYVQLEGHVVLAEIALQKHNLTQAKTEYRAALALVADTESEEYGRFQRLEARLALAHDDTARAIALLIANEMLFTDLQNVPETQRTRQLLAEVLATLHPNNNSRSAGQQAH